MKLYTEEQVREILMSINTFRHISDSYIDDIIDSLTPIELPSDEEIVNQSLLVGWTNTLFTDGAKWMRDKIKGGNK